MFLYSGNRKICTLIRLKGTKELPKSAFQATGGFHPLLVINSTWRRKRVGRKLLQL